MFYSSLERRSYQILMPQHKNRKIKSAEHKFRLWYIKNWAKKVCSEGQPLCSEQEPQRFDEGRYSVLD